jgi:hypothetical protein
MLRAVGQWATGVRKTSERASRKTPRMWDKNLGPVGVSAVFRHRLQPHPGPVSITKIGRVDRSGADKVPLEVPYRQQFAIFEAKYLRAAIGRIPQATYYRHRPLEAVISTV